jgi:hypothetical protein
MLCMSFREDIGFTSKADSITNFVDHISIIGELVRDKMENEFGFYSFRERGELKFWIKIVVEYV